MRRGNDLIFAFPQLVIAILITAIFGGSAINAIIAIGIFNTPSLPRITRGAALKSVGAWFILAARVAANPRLGSRVEHILPNYQICDRSRARSRLQPWLFWPRQGCPMTGLCAQPPTPSWGRMLWPNAQTMVSIARIWRWCPLAIILTVLGAEPDGRTRLRDSTGPTGCGLDL